MASSDPTEGEASPAIAGPAESSFGVWLAGIPKTFALLTAAIAAVLGLFAPDRLVPEPLQGLRVVATLLTGVGFLLAWAWRGAIRRHARAVITVTALLVVVLALLNVFFVHDVRIPADAPAARYFILGPSVADPQFEGAFPAEIIGQEGDNWTALRTVWGGGFVAVAVAYSLCYVLLLPAMVLAIGATEFGTPRRRAPATAGEG